MDLVFASPTAISPPTGSLTKNSESNSLGPSVTKSSSGDSNWHQSQTVLPAVTVATAAALFAASGRRRRLRQERLATSCRPGSGGLSQVGKGALQPVGSRLRQNPFFRRIFGGLQSRFNERPERRVSVSRSQAGEESVDTDTNNEYAYRMVKIAIVVTVLPFLFCLKNFFTDPSLSDFNLEYGPHLGHPALRATSTIQFIMVTAAVLWREKYRNDPIDRLFAWLFVPEAVTHVLLHFFSHHWGPANFAFAYAFSAGIALPGFLSLMCYVPKETKLPWAYLVLYMATQIPIIYGLTDMVGGAKLRLMFANLNTGILKRWNDVPKASVFLATLTITYQITMGIIGPITGGSAVKLYDPSCIFQHGVVDIGFGIAYAVSIVRGVFNKGVPRPSWKGL
eukprot:TRINITY_DN10714_c0_g1_i2.p1 TRINITY_DN10714_c0_g1~~TRINITY_DN10714_c0_g1_i2.p1  ORF type:complete len:394 (-),score=52.57 TRINITY_DN10714_c0_g1_i2:289-1470(-)